MAVYDPVDPRADFPALERDILAFWRDRDVFRRSLEARRGSPEWVFYDGPPTANNRPHIGHVEARTFKDLYPRFRTMTGRYVNRKAGWDCHGLPVEVEVEKAIGTRSKRDIEAFGVAEFVRLCRESVQRYVEDWKRVSDRMGFWIDMDDAYWTMEPAYVESVWWALKTLYRRGLLYQDDRSVAYCPRCGTALSDAEVAMGYATVDDPSIFVKLPVLESPGRPDLVGSALVVWTTTPWTLISNLGVAVAPNEMYVRAEVDGESLLVAERLLPVLGDSAVARDTMNGATLVGIRYEPPYPNLDGDVHRVVAADFVSMDEGTGLVHIAPGFGADDLALGRREGWPPYRPLDDDARFTDETEVGFVRGLFVKDADPKIIEDLRARDRLLRAETYRHTYPLCWRCSTPLLYMARTSWYVRTTARKDRLLEVNEEVSWYPEHIKHGRYGDWLRSNVDWALSRERYWGTPLPLWRCGEGHVTAVGSLRELSDLAGRDVTAIDPHRPAIDEVEIRCPECDRGARRVPEVIDAWFDSGAMPFAQWGFHPELGRGEDEFERRFPADFIAEGIDQTRGWFYSLMAEGVLLFDSTAYRNVVCHGLVLDAEGRKMSKRLGNVIDPEDAFDRFGADAVRWFMLVSGSPWTDRRGSFDIIEELVRQFLLKLWNVYSFFVTYANADGIDAASLESPVPDRPDLDRWIVSRLHRTAAEVRQGLESFDASGAGRRIAALVDDLSHWYVRRARRRFWDPAGEGDRSGKEAAYATLHDCLTTVALLLAPFAPFVSEALWRNLAAGRDGAPDSVHLADFPEPNPSLVDGRLEEAMETIRRIVSLGRTVRNETGVKVRQPLGRAVVHVTGDPQRLTGLLHLAADELNVREIRFAGSAEELAGWRARPNFRALGPKLGPRVRGVARALEEDDGTLAAELARGRPVEVSADGDLLSIGPQDVELSQETETGWGMAAEGGLTVALDLTVTPDLRREGLARDLVRAVQDARKAAGLEVSDRIELAVDAGGEPGRALDEHREWIAGEVLATAVTRGSDPGWPDAHRRRVTIDGLEIEVSLRPV
ncbi:MAG TPA: isoleucine--tRNA ligase [Actinomycetota bacterium]|nr:isoleucine--tRNA ligase [Actinomycetota bacterium]